MGFLAPWFLAGAAAVGIPLYIHLLRQNRAPQFKFSSLMFLERRTESSLKQRRLRYLLLFALRVALIMLLALAFANPYVSRKVAPVARGSKLIVVALDHSFSMQQKGAFERAKQDALGVLNSFRPGDQGIVVGWAGQAQLVTQTVTDAAPMRQAIAALQPTDGRASLAELARALRDIRTGAKLPVEVHVCSDLQQTAMPAQFSDLELSPGTRLVVHPAVSSARPNWFVENVSAPGYTFSPKKVRVQATVAGAATTERSVPVSLVLNGRTLETKQVSLAVNSRSSVDFAPIDVPYGQNKGEVRIETGDALPADDHAWFAINRGEPRHILFVSEGRSQRAQLYYQSALDAGSDAAFTVDPSGPSQAANLNLQKYALVVLSDPGQLPSNFVEVLNRYVRSGGSLFVSAGPMLAAQNRIPIWDAAIRGTSYSTRTGDRFQTAEYVDTEHPATKKSGHWEGVRFFQSVRVDPGDGRVLAKLSDDTPVLVEKQVGEGKVILFASTFDNVANDFPLHTSFVPFIAQTAEYLGGGGDRQARQTVDANLELRASRNEATSLEVLGPDGRRALSLADAAKAETISLTQQGFYEVRRSNGRQELIAVNPDRRESDLQTLPADTLALWQNTGQVQNAAGSTSEQLQKSPLWWYVLLVLLLIAITESVIANRFIPTERESS